MKRSSKFNPNLTALNNNNQSHNSKMHEKLLYCNEDATYEHIAPNEHNPFHKYLKNPKVFKNLITRSKMHECV